MRICKDLIYTEDCLRATGSFQAYVQNLCRVCIRKGRFVGTVDALLHMQLGLRDQRGCEETGVMLWEWQKHM